METIYLTNAEGNRLIRKALADKFPGVKFSVRHSGAGSTDIRWTDGPLVAAVEEVTNSFIGASFDGMIDYESTVYHTDENGRRVHFGVKYIFCTREVSPERYSEARDLIVRWYAAQGTDITDVPMHTWMEAPSGFYRLTDQGWGWEGSLDMLTRRVAEHLASATV